MAQRDHGRRIGGDTPTNRACSVIGDPHDFDQVIKVELER